MMRPAMAAVLVAALTGCQGEGAFYDAAAKRKARAAAPKAAWNGYGKLVSVGPAVERAECSEAVPFRAGRCLDVVVTSRLPVVDGSGDSVPIRTHVFVWLEKAHGSWTVQYTTFWSPDVTVEIRLPGAPRSGSSIAPPWLRGATIGP